MGLSQDGKAGEPGADSGMGSAKRFAPEDRGFRLHTQVVNSILQPCPQGCGSGSLQEAHLVDPLVLAVACRLWWAPHQ